MSLQQQVVLGASIMTMFFVTILLASLTISTVSLVRDSADPAAFLAEEKAERRRSRVFFARLARHRRFIASQSLFQWDPALGFRSYRNDEPGHSWHDAHQSNVDRFSPFSDG